MSEQSEQSEQSEHPASYLLEEFAAGAGDEPTARHVETCDGCRSYVERFRGAAARFARESVSADVFADRVVSRSQSSRKVAWVGVAGTLSLVAAAAVILLLLRPPETATGPVALATTPQAEDVEGVRFKGGPQVAIIREREGRQVRLVTDAGIRPGDRLRVEVSVDAAATVEVGVLSEDGAWVTLMSASMLTPGTHFTPKAVRFDDSPSAGWILAGAPDAVARARSTRQFDSVTVLPLHVEKDP
jgi:hypothetical protein